MDRRPKRHFNTSYTVKIDEYREHLVYERQLADTTINNYVFFMCEFGEFFGRDFLEVQTKDIKDFIKYMRTRGVSNSSISNYIIALRSFYNWFSNLNNTPEMINLAFHLSKVVRIRRDSGVPEVPTINEIDKLRETLHAYKSALSYNKRAEAYRIVLRDAAIFETLLSTGARSFEIRNMRPCDFDLNNGSVLIWAAKGARQRVSIFGDLAQKTIKEHIEHNNFGPNDNVFVVRNGNMLNYIIKRWAKRASINERLHAHSFRHYHVTEAQRSGVNIQAVADQVGHVCLNTTRHYTHFDVNYRRDEYGKAKI